MGETATHDELQNRIRELEQTVKDITRVTNEWVTAFDSVRDAIWILDDRQRIVRCNKASERLFHSPPNEMIGKFCWEIVHSTDKPIPECPIQRSLKSLKREDMELQIGQSHYLVTVDPILDSDGSYQGAVHIVSDITERKQMEKNLSESERKYHNLFKNGTDLLCIHDLQGNLIETNVAYKKQYGLKDKDLVGSNLHSFMPEQYKPEFEKYLQRIIQNGEDEGYLRLMDLFGEDVILEYHNILIRDEEGNPTAVQGSARDVTSRVRAEMALRKSEAQKEAILNASIDSIRLVDTDLRIIWANKIVEQEMKKSQTNVVGNFCYSVFTERDQPCPNCSTLKALKSGKLEHSFISEENVKGIPGKSYWSDYAIPIKDESGQIINLIQISRNITDIKKTEIKLREERNKLQNALEKVRKLSGLLPICSICKKIRDDSGYWTQLEAFIENHSEAEFSHSICEECAKKHYSDLDIYGNDQD
jgi:PAS domain S-box-containing protein